MAHPILIVGILLVAACMVAGIVFLRRSNEIRRLENNPLASPAQKPRKPWAVYILDHPAGAPVCDAARKLHFRHFGQSQQLPVLPLKDCGKKESCQCYHREVMEKRRAQRRVGRDRREEFRFDPGKSAKPERRKLKDRRAARIQWDGYDTDR